CQSLNEPGGVERNTTPFALWSAVNSGCDARSSSSMCDSLSSPEYKRKIPMQDSPQATVGRPRFAIASRRLRGRYGAIVHHGEVACHDLVLRTGGGALPLFPLLRLSQTPVCSTLANLSNNPCLWCTETHSSFNAQETSCTRQLYSPSSVWYCTVTVMHR